MARKNKKNVIQDVAVDKVDSFLHKNFKKIIVLSFLVIAVFIAAYSMNKYSKNRNEQLSASIGELEIKGLYSYDRIKEYSELAEKLDFAKDYIHLRAGQSYLMLDFKDNAKAELFETGGKFDEFAKSLLYDISDGGEVNPKLMNDGMFSMLWYYRAILDASEDNREALVEDFSRKWPDSMLLNKIHSWDL